MLYGKFTINAQGRAGHSKILMADQNDIENNKSTRPFKRQEIFVFGGTGLSGSELVKQALEVGHGVTMLARNPDNVNNIQHDNLKVVKGDIHTIETYESELSGKDAVLSCLGNHGLGPFVTTTFYSDTIKLIFDAMKKSGVVRFIVITSWCTRSLPGNPKLYEWFMKPLFVRGVFKDFVLMEDYMADTDPAELNYTIVKPPRLTNDAGNGNYKIEEGQCNTSTTIRIPRADVAHFMLTALQTNDYDRKEIAIASIQ